MKRIKGKRLICAVCILALLVPAVSFGAVKTIPDSTVMVSESTVLKMRSSNITAKWNGVTGKTVNETVNNAPCLMIPIKSTSSQWSYSDFLDVTFKNAGTVSGRSIDVKLHFNKMTVEAPYKTSGTWVRDDRYMCVMALYGDSPYIGTGVTAGVGYTAAAVYDITASVVWSDTGEVVNLPFFMAVRDIDAGSSSTYLEGWEAVSGFTGTYYIYRENALSISGNRFTTAGVATSGQDTLLKGGLYAPTGGGTFRMKFYGGSCGTGIHLYNQYVLLQPPAKSIQ